MNENKVKLNLIRSEIEKSAEKESAALIEAAEKETADMLAKLKTELQKKRSGNITSITESYKNDRRRRVSEVCFEEGRRVLLFRNGLVEEFFKKVEKRITELTETDKYDEYLKLAIKKADKLYPVEGTDIFCRERDTNAVVKALGDISCSVSAADNIKLGGIIIRFESGMLIDLTLDSALEAERGKFSSLKEMQL